MTKIKNNISKVIILLFSVLLFTSCNKDNIEEESNEFSITSLEERNTVYAKQEASYQLSLPVSTIGYQIKVIADVSDNLSSTLNIDGNSIDFDTFSNFSGGEFRINITPNAVGNTNFIIEIKKGDVVKTKNITLTSKMPEFTIQLDAESVNVELSETTNITVTVNFTGDYEHNLIYKASISNNVTSNPTVYEEIEGTPKPDLVFEISHHLISEQTVTIEVTNEFGYTQSKEIVIHFYCAVGNC